MVGVLSGTQPRWHIVDVLRGVAALAVVLLHIDIRIPAAKSSMGAWLGTDITRIVFRSGAYGVKVFFVISGFLITANILKRWGSLENLDVRGFYRLRFARIAPCLLALLAILSVLHLANVEGFVVRRATLPRALFAALTFHSNQLEIWNGYLPANWNVLWSLSVEETFYLSYPLLCRYVRSRWILIAIGLTLLALGPFARTIWAGGNEIASDQAYLGGFDCIALGCAAAVAAHQGLGGPMLRPFLKWIGVSLMALPVFFRGAANYLHLGRAGLDDTVLALGAALLLYGSRPDAPQWKWMIPFEWGGRVSYETYLTHSFFTVLGFQWYKAIGAGPGRAELHSALGSRNCGCIFPVWLGRRQVVL